MPASDVSRGLRSVRNGLADEHVRNCSAPSQCPDHSLVSHHGSANQCRSSRSSVIIPSCGCLDAFSHPLEFRISVPKIDSASRRTSLGATLQWPQIGASFRDMSPHYSIRRLFRVAPLGKRGVILSVSCRCSTFVEGQLAARKCQNGLDAYRSCEQ